MPIETVQPHLIPLDVATKLALSLGVGLFSGFEREWSRKDVGVRTFALTALLGTLSSLVSIQFSLACLGAVALVIGLVNGRALLLRQNLEITTSVSLLIDFVLGVLIGLGEVIAGCRERLLPDSHARAKISPQELCPFLCLPPAEQRCARLLATRGRSYACL